MCVCMCLLDAGLNECGRDVCVCGERIDCGELGAEISKESRCELVRRNGPGLHARVRVQLAQHAPLHALGRHLHPRPLPLAGQRSLPLSVRLLQPTTPALKGSSPSPSLVHHARGTEWFNTEAGLSERRANVSGVLRGAIIGSKWATAWRCRAWSPGLSAAGVRAWVAGWTRWTRYAGVC